nr:glycosyltransferase [Stutzerimonas stutzeri]
MSVYNGEKYLAEAIKSILSQSLIEFEFIIINDGSTDNSLEIIQSFMSLDKRIVLISRENKGLVASLNEGISVAKGKYIARMDADDVAKDIRFERQVSFLDKNPDVGVCGSWVRIFGENIKPAIWRMPASDKALRPRLLFSVPVAHPSVMFRRDIVVNASLRYDEEYKNAEDYKFWVELSRYTKFANIQKVLLDYRYHTASISRVADKKKSEDRFLTITKIQAGMQSGLGLDIDEKDRLIGFVLALNDRMPGSPFSLFEVRNYLLKLYKKNKEVELFDNFSLYCFLSRKYFIYAVKRYKFGFFDFGGIGMLLFGLVSTICNI